MNSKDAKIKGEGEASEGVNKVVIHDSQLVTQKYPQTNGSGRIARHNSQGLSSTPLLVRIWDKSLSLVMHMV